VHVGLRSGVETDVLGISTHDVASVRVMFVLRLPSCICIYCWKVHNTHWQFSCNDSCDSHSPSILHSNSFQFSPVSQSVSQSLKVRSMCRCCCRYPIGGCSARVLRLLVNEAAILNSRDKVRRPRCSAVCRNLFTPQTSHTLNSRDKVRRQLIA
jgi:hypothetical protein